MNWTDDLNDREREEWEAYVSHFRHSTLKDIAASDAYVAVLSHDGAGEVRFWTELGAGLMLDKPIFVVVMPDVKVSERLLRAADRVVEADPDTEEGRDLIKAEMAKFFEEFPQKGD